MGRKLYMSLMVVVIVLTIVLAGCTAQKCIEKPIEDCVCTLQYDPVCGCNQKTYSNACAAECAGIREYRKGPCEKL